MQREKKETLKARYLPLSKVSVPVMRRMYAVSYTHLTLPTNREV